jgi:hypothetical protein
LVPVRSSPTILPIFKLLRSSTNGGISKRCVVSVERERERKKREREREREERGKRKRKGRNDLEITEV